jgi:hypothetical protein
LGKLSGTEVAMAKSIGFKTSITVKHMLPTVAGEAAVQCVEKLRAQCPDIESITHEVAPQDRNEKIGAGYKVHVSGTIYFKPGQKPDLTRLNYEGLACFSRDFLLLDAFPVNTTSNSASSFPVFCRMCGKEVGQIKSVIANIAATGTDDHFMKEKQRIVTAHLKAAHPDLDAESFIL